MSSWSGGSMTAAGRLLYSKVMANGIPLVITSMKLGDGVETIDDVDGLIELQNPRYEMAISNKEIQNELCKVTGMVLSSRVNTGFYARELGLFAQDPDRGEILYMIAIDSNPDYVPPSSHSVTTTAEYSLGIVVSNAAEINITIDPSALATNTYVNKASFVLQRKTSYEVGDVVRDTRLRPGYVLECISSGTTNASELIIKDVAIGERVTDGTVVWEHRKLATLDPVTVNQMITDLVNNALSAEGLEDKVNAAVEKTVENVASERIDDAVKNAVKESVTDNVADLVTPVIESKIAESESIKEIVNNRVNEKLTDELKTTVDNIIKENVGEDLKDTINESANIKGEGKEYQINDILNSPQLRPGTVLVCVKAGTTSTTPIDLSEATLGELISDGTAQWQVCRLNVGVGLIESEDGFVFG